MDTTQEKVDNLVDNDEIYEQAVDILTSGGIVAFPTETVYGLGAIATDEQAVRRIFEAKGRPSDNPLIVHIGNQSDITKYATDVPEIAHQLMDAFWPGPLTLIMEKKPGVIADVVTAGLSTVAIRMPDHPVALQLLRKLNMPLAAPSANRSGKPSPTEAGHVYHDLIGRVPLILDGGETGIGVESTILDITVTPPVILRPGGITKEQLEELIGPVHLATQPADPSSAPRAPGMKYTHYAPEAPLFVIEPNAAYIENALAAIHRQNKRAAIIGPDELYTEHADWYFSTGPIDSREAMASSLYKAIRQCDHTEADIILAIETDLSGIGAAVMNRLNKASDGRRFTE
ncbi:threonylcarbamoyl-AMP synthase [Sporosarcina sp. P37]|uniref:L-threonylcarbamoyladenylate synthase n=1 Tax=unclassified Sporosarcina TaxID=2647733 RepID=UPI0009C0E835|nr:MULTISPECIES: L-threonylcarbamoyladenylate synthase [unclassified Sporosarcina]ARD48781.1 tRNA threonylcarbamoyladenosine biosynthesis protein [Sporosarcina sp. P33]ARK25283.1 threonylcarbamoyl-AMP synthase [Sporosarcina sp. P37]PID17839.1 L-threonylcarbamoyladenylate synthase [Sporosarcina sp. P35]